MQVSPGIYKHHKLDLTVEVKGRAKVLTNYKKNGSIGYIYYDDCFFDIGAGNELYQGELFNGKNNIYWFNALDEEKRLPYFWFEDTLVVYTREKDPNRLIVAHPYFILEEVPGGVHRYNRTI